jgi:hypothetical protein
VEQNWLLAAHYRLVITSPSLFSSPLSSTPADPYLQHTQEDKKASMLTVFIFRTLLAAGELPPTLQYTAAMAQTLQLQVRFSSHLLFSLLTPAS